MNHFNRLIKISAVGLLISSCAPTAKQIKEAVESDPSIVFSAIEKAPRSIYRSCDESSAISPEDGR